MKFYIQLTDSYFITAAPSPEHAIVSFWRFRIDHPETKFEPQIEAEYQIHRGRAEESQTISSGASWWLLDRGEKQLIREFIERSRPQDYDGFCSEILNSTPRDLR